MNTDSDQDQPRATVRAQARRGLQRGLPQVRDRAWALKGIVTARALAVATLVAAVLVGLGVATGRTAASSSRIERAALGTRSGEPIVVKSEDDPVRTVDDVTAIWSLQGILDRMLNQDPSRNGSTGTNSVVGAMQAVTTATTDLSRTFDGRPLRAIRTMSMVVTAYSPDERSCGASADGITASGYSVYVNGGCLVAADPKVLPLGSLVSVPGYDGGAVVPVLDTGGAIKGQRLDVLFPTHRQALEWGRRTIEVTVWEYDDGKPNGFQRVRRKDRGGI